jgi:hypothetical protein
MKKIILAIAAVALIASPALAVDWNFYGSARMATYWDDRDFGDGTNAAGTDDEDADLIWDFQGNSRIGATVKAENVSGRFELGLKGSGAGDVDVGTRRLFGVWDFGAGKLKIGKDYTPISQFISGQAFDGDLGLLGIGTMYGNRTGQASLSFGGFEIALIQPNSGLAVGMSNATTINSLAGGLGNPNLVLANPAFTGGDVDEWLPKIEAKFGMAFDTFNFNVRGGYQTYEIEDFVSPVSGNTKSVDIDSYAIGADVGVNFGPAYVKGAISYGVNTGNAAWHLDGLRTGGSQALFDGNDDVKDTDTIMGALVAGFKFTDQVSFEAGWGYRSDDPDLAGTDEDEAWELYVQSVISLAPGVYIIPEIGYTDYMDDAAGDDEGDRWYLGGKWQIDF